MPPKQIKNLKYYASGKRGIICTFSKNNILYALKTKNPSSIAEERIKNEARYLKILNKYDIGPKLISSGKDYVIYEFINGKLLKDAKFKSIHIKQILQQCYQIDKLKLNKMEMHHPLKHIIINRNKAYLIDFERCYKTNHPKNITQFCQYLMERNLIPKKETKLILKNYKKTYSKKEFEKLLSLVSYSQRH